MADKNTHSPRRLNAIGASFATLAPSQRLAENLFKNKPLTLFELP